MDNLPTLTITVEEGVIVWIPPRANKEGRWRLLPAKGKKGTRPVPRRLLAQAGLLGRRSE